MIAFLPGAMNGYLTHERVKLGKTSSWGDVGGLFADKGFTQREGRAVLFAPKPIVTRDRTEVLKMLL